MHVLHDSIALQGDSMHFEVTQQGGEYAVLAISPKAGNDTGVIAFFDHVTSAMELADILNYASTELIKSRAAKWG